MGDLVRWLRLRHGRRALPTCSSVFVSIWVGVLAVHAISCMYFLFMWWFYRMLPDTKLQRSFSLYNLGVASTHYPVLSRIHCVFFLFHALGGSLMVLSSLWWRRLSFGPWYALQTSQAVTRRACGPRSQRSYSRFVQTVSMCFTRFFGRKGVFGIEGPYYDTFHLLRQTAETILQSYQAYRMSQHIPRPWLNNLYVGLVALGCWSIPTAKALAGHDVMRELLLLIICDALLDLSSAIGIPIIMIYSYNPDYDRAGYTVWMQLWYDDKWIVRAVNEAQFILVGSWTDLLTRLAFSFGLLWHLENIKDITVLTCRRQHQTQAKASSTTELIQSPIPVPSSSGKMKVVPTSISRTDPLLVSKRRLKTVPQVLLALWGIVVLGLHIHAASRATIHECLMQVRPWLTHKSACALLLVDCYATGVIGNETDATAVWHQVDDATVSRVLVRHCPSFHVPVQLKAFHQLLGIKFYNTSIADWPDEAALTQTDHPHLMTALFARVNMTNGELPRGLQSVDSPRFMLDVQFCVTNLRSLPDDLDTKWPAGGAYHFEYSPFQGIPPSILRLNPRQLSFFGDHLSRFPQEVFAVHKLAILNLAANPYSTLAATPYQHIVDNSSIFRIFLGQTNVSTLPKWLDQLFARNLGSAKPPVVLGSTPICKQLKNGTSLQSLADAGRIPEDERSFVTSLSATEAAPFIACSTSIKAFYLLSYEDTWNSIS